LLLVIGSALLMDLVGISMILGAFLAGMLLADSEYRHQLVADIAPFKGLLLGLFFIAVGMSVNIGLLLDSPLRVMLIVVLLMTTKAIILYPLARQFGMCDPAAALKLAAVLAQGGEFAFVLLTIAASELILPQILIDELVLAVALSMLMTPFIYAAAERAGGRFHKPPAPEFDTPIDNYHDVLIVGFGRVGQIIGRLLNIVGYSFTALERDSAQVEFVRRYGTTVHYGDASRLDLLRAAGAEHAKIFVLAVSKLDESMQIAESVMHNFPHLKIIARARNRRHAHKLMDLGVEHIFRETLLSSLAMSEQVLNSLGQTSEDAKHIVDSFRERDEQLLFEQQAIHDSEDLLIQTSKDTATELESLLRQDNLDE